MATHDSKPGIRTPEEALKAAFGYDSFRPLQREIIGKVLEKRDTLAVMPTGGGKSLCYQIPALIFPGLTVVVSPLIALMQDQVNALEARGIGSLVLNSAIAREEYYVNMERVRSGTVRLLYLAPETLVTPRVQELLAAVRVDCLAVDEAHCISDWGHDFRPEYRKLAEIRALFPHAVCLAMTATATARVRKDIAKNLALENPAQFVASFDRANIYLEVMRKQKSLDQIARFIEERPGESGIVYCFSRSSAEKVASELSDRGIPSLPYHAGLPDKTRADNQEKFLRDDIRVMAATVAFGMGIDKPNVRFVIHHDLPKSVEQYYQEIGRAGRDGKPSHALLLYGYGDARKIRFLMEDKSASESRKAETQLKDMMTFAESTTCRRKTLLAYFGEIGTARAKTASARAEASGALFDSSASASARAEASTRLPDPALRLPCCDVCERGAAPEDTDVTVIAQKFLSCVLRTGERFGAAYVIDVLLGSRQKRIVDNGHTAVSTWGIGRELAKEDWFELVRLLLEAGYLRKDEEYGVLSLSQEGRDVLRSRASVLLPFARLPAGIGSDGLVSPAGTAVPGSVCRGMSGSAGVRKSGNQTRAARNAPAAAAGPLSEDSRKLADALRALRKRIAEEERIAPFMVFSERTLEELAAVMPRTRRELLSVRGIGEVRADRLGGAILSLVEEIVDNE